MDMFDKWLHDTTIGENEILQRQVMVTHEYIQLEVKNVLLESVQKASRPDMCAAVLLACRTDKPLSLKKIIELSAYVGLKPKILFEQEVQNE